MASTETATKSSMSKITSDESVIRKLRHYNEDRLYQLARMHLLFTIDCHGDSLSSLFNENQLAHGDEKKRNNHHSGQNGHTISHNVDKCDKQTSNSGFFINENVIKMMTLLINYISHEENIVQEGIFRVCGSLVRQNELKQKLLASEILSFQESKYTVHDCANVLKTILSELHEPLLTDIHFKILCRLSNKIADKIKPPESGENFEKQLKKLQLLMLLLPEMVRNFTAVLLRLLATASKHSEQNKMTSKNFAMMFAPHLLFPKSLRPDEMQQHREILTDELQFMIDNVEHLFQAPKELLIDVRKDLQSIAEGTFDGTINTVTTFCERQTNVDERDYTERNLAELYAYVNSLPETPKKRNLVKQFNRQNGGITPTISAKENNLKKSNVFKVLGNRIRKGFHLFPHTKSVNIETSNKFSKSCEELNEKRSSAADMSICSWSSDSNINSANVTHESLSGDIGDKKAET